MTEPAIVVGEQTGIHNQDLTRSRARLEKGKSYRDLSTVIVVPSRGEGVPPRVVQNWMALMKPMNQKCLHIFIERMEVGEAYNAAINHILNNEDLSNWKYVLTLEEDNMPPPDGLLRLYENMDDFDVVGGLYWTKGEEGMPMIYGKPEGILDFVPQLPQIDTTQECNGLGMGFTLFKMEMFKSMDPPWFKTLQEWDPAVGTRAFTQDLYFFEKARKAGRRIACDTRIKVGHLDASTGVCW